MVSQFWNQDYFFLYSTGVTTWIVLGLDSYLRFWDVKTRQLLSAVRSWIIIHDVACNSTICIWATYLEQRYKIIFDYCCLLSLHFCSWWNKILVLYIWGKSNDYLSFCWYVRVSDLFASLKSSWFCNWNYTLINCIVVSRFSWSSILLRSFLIPHLLIKVSSDRSLLVLAWRSISLTIAWHGY